MNTIHYTNIILSVIGPDKPGIVSDVSNIVRKFSGNIEKSRMIKLGDFFTIMVLVTINKEQIEFIEKGFEDLSDYQVSINELKNTDKEITENTHTIYLDGIDSEGIVYKITNQLAAMDINIEELETDLQNAPMSGVGLFSLKAIVSHPNLSYEILSSKMDDLATMLDVNIIVES